MQFPSPQHLQASLDAQAAESPNDVAGDNDRFREAVCLGYKGKYSQALEILKQVSNRRLWPVMRGSFDVVLRHQTGRTLRATGPREAVEVTRFASTTATQAEMREYIDHVLLGWVQDLVARRGFDAYPSAVQLTRFASTDQARSDMLGLFRPSELVSSPALVDDVHAPQHIHVAKDLQTKSHEIADASTQAATPAQRGRTPMVQPAPFSLSL